MEVLNNRFNKGVLISLVLVLSIAALLRFFDLGKGEVLTDEVFYSFRAIKLVDFVEADNQPTPYEWFDPDIPLWTRYSFHDHPPLVFLIQHVSIRAFGDTPFAIRFPSAVFGVLSVLLVYIIGARYFDKRAALLGALFLAVTVSHVYISRLALQEATIIFFILLTLYSIIRTLDRDRYFLLLGVSLGLALLTKFTALILIPVIFVFYYIFKRRTFRNKHFWKGLLIALLLFTPVIYYNIRLYQAVGHFDFQFSYLFGQDPEVWKVAPGKEIGTIGDRMRDFFPNLFSLNSWVFLIISFVGMAYSAFFLKRWKERSYFDIIGTGLPLLFIVIIALFLLYIGPSLRFLSMLTPLLALAIAPFAHFLLQKRTALLSVFIPILLFELFFTANTFFTGTSIGTKGITYSTVQNDTYQWGYREVGEYLDEELYAKMPAIVSDMTFEFLNELHDERVTAYTESGAEPYAALILYDENIFFVPQLWYFDRLNFIHAWPVMKIGSFLEIREANPGFLENFDVVYVVIATEDTLLKWPLTDSARVFELELVEDKLKHQSISNEAGEESFRIYRYSPDELVQ